MDKLDMPLDDIIAMKHRSDVVKPVKPKRGILKVQSKVPSTTRGGKTMSRVTTNAPMPPSKRLRARKKDKQPMTVLIGGRSGKKNVVVTSNVANKFSGRLGERRVARKLISPKGLNRNGNVIANQNGNGINGKKIARADSVTQKVGNKQPKITVTLNGVSSSGGIVMPVASNPVINVQRKKPPHDGTSKKVKKVTPPQSVDRSISPKDDHISTPHQMDIDSPMSSTVVNSGYSNTIWTHDKFDASQGSAKPQPRGICVRGLHHSVTEEDMRELFGEVGPMRRIAMGYDSTGRFTGAVEVEFISPEHAVAARNKYNQRTLDGLVMVIEYLPVNIGKRTGYMKVSQSESFNSTGVDIVPTQSQGIFSKTHNLEYVQQTRNMDTTQFATIYCSP